MGPISLSKDTSIPADEQWSITCFIVGNPGREWSKYSIAERKSRVLKQFCDAFSTVLSSSSSGDFRTVPETVNTIEQEWSREPYFWGAQSPVMPPGVLTGVGKEMCTPVGKVHFVGTETSTVWKGYMEGAVRSGHSGAKELNDALRATTGLMAHIMETSPSKHSF